MSFSEKVTSEALAKCGRYCCICHKFCGIKMELHHIKQKAYGGEDTLENCIPLCFDCHSEMGKSDPKHPKGKRYTEEELRLHRDNWYRKMENAIFSPEKIVYQEDVELFRNICGYFTPSLRSWLSEEDIGCTHPYQVYDNLDKILYDFNDPFFEFINPELEKLKGNLYHSVNSFLIYKSINTWVKHIGQTKICVTRLWMLEHENLRCSESYSEDLAQFEKEARELNDLASDVWETYCVFVQQGRRLLSK